MGFWSWLTSEPSGNTDSPGDPDGVVFEGEATESRALPVVRPSPWAGWPAEWGVPNWDFRSRFNELIDVAWNCLDLNASVLSSMPVYRTRSGEIIEPETWMTNPDTTIYSSWHEFAKQLFWDYQLGESFVLPMAFYSDGWPMRFRVIPPWVMHVEMRGGMRAYKLGGAEGTDVTADILHIRYKSTTDSPRGVGPLESAGARMLTAGVLAKYIREVAEMGGVVAQTLETETPLEPEDARELQEEWVKSRASSAAPPVLDNAVTLKTHHVMSPKDMAMLELAQFTESRIANLLGVPPFLVGLPATGGTGGESMTYSNVSQLFDFHDRASLRPKATHVMSAVSGWALPPDEAAELNRDEYSRPAFNERTDAYVKLIEIGALSVPEWRAMERLNSKLAASALTGGDGSANGDRAAVTPRELAEMIQKIYLGVGVVLSAEEARDILNQAGAGLVGLPDLVGRPKTATPSQEVTP